MAVGVVISDPELKRAINKIRALGDIVNRRQRLQMLRNGANILRDAARANVPIADEPYVMYRKNGGTKKEAVMSILPGFVRDAIKVKSFRKSSALFVGIDKVQGILAYWATWLEFGATNRDGSKREGAHFMRKALSAVGDQVVAQIIKDATRLFDRKIKELQVK